jgi:uncharacterized membrane protein YkvA (DUF1232 family)
MHKLLFKQVFSQPILSGYRQLLRHPKFGIWIVLASLLYLADPFDVAPDFVPVVGWLDDGVVASLLVAELSQTAVQRLKAKKQKRQAAADSQPATLEVSTS